MREVHRVVTPENVAFEFERAALPARALAWAIDVLAMIALAAIALRLVSLLGAAGGFATALGFVVIFVIQWGYSAISEWALSGQTLGKRIVGLRVLDERGLRIGFVQAVVRNLVRTVDFLPGAYLIGGTCALLDPKGRRLGDLAAGTIVVRERRAPAPAAIVPPSERHNTFVRDPGVALAARRITPPERDAMIALGLRRERLPIAIRHELFGRLADHLEARLGVPRPAFFSPEKYVLNLTAVVLGATDEPARRGP